jgi:signal transduction histidine kinase/CheY-like chemotaxis protein
LTGQFPHRLNEAANEQGIRDLMGLLALPALWAGRDGQAILQIMAEAVERLVPLRFSCARIIVLPGLPPTTPIRVDGKALQDDELTAWHLAATAWPNGPTANARVHLCDTPLGKMNVVHLKLGYKSAGGSIWFGSSQPDFPTFTQLAVLRAAASLAASGLQTARLSHEREEAIRAKDEFLAMLGHELRNPLAPIGAAAELLQLVKLDDVQLKRTSEIISRQVGHLTNLVNDILDVSRVNSGLVTIEKMPHAVKGIIADAIEQVRPLLDARRHHFTVHLAPGLVQISGDQKRLVQVMTNLLTNAAKYTPEGGNIALRIDAGKSQVAISVSDDGIGMDRELLPNVFGLFTQAKRTSDRSQGGLGLGLALVKSLVELHGGTVAAHSNGAGGGSRFTVTLPRLIDPAGSARNDIASVLEPVSKSLRLMVVDDNADAAQMLAMLLEAIGHDVLVENDPYRALERARMDAPDAYLLDIGLPGMDGNELARRLRTLSHASTAVLIAVTGYGQEYDRDTAIKAGFDHHFIKPVNTAKLMAVLADICERRCVGI